MLLCKISKTQCFYIFYRDSICVCVCVCVCVCFSITHWKNTNFLIKIRSLFISIRDLSSFSSRATKLKIVNWLPKIHWKFRRYSRKKRACWTFVPIGEKKKKKKTFEQTSVRKPPRCETRKNESTGWLFAGWRSVFFSAPRTMMSEL